MSEQKYQHKVVQDLSDLHDEWKERLANNPGVKSLLSSVPDFLQMLDEDESDETRAMLTDFAKSIARIVQ